MAIKKQLHINLSINIDYGFMIHRFMIYRFIDSYRFIPTSLSELIDNTSGNVNGTECKSSTENNRCEDCEKIIEGLIEKFPDTYQLCNGNLNKFVY